MIVALEDAKYKLLGMRESIEELGSALRIEETKELLFDLEAQTQAPDFWNSAEKSSKVLQTIKQGQDKVAGYEKLCARLEDAIALAEMAIERKRFRMARRAYGTDLTKCRKKLCCRNLR